MGTPVVRKCTFDILSMTICIKTEEEFALVADSVRAKITAMAGPIVFLERRRTVSRFHWVKETCRLIIAEVA